ncbi:winged helix-turn-helix transcriptional regulator [Candidatus Woesearchaeota archaeon]|nr:winged helix-turn-helix transcriptional regulator [Candidatus Woesearchaeota archaeon]
MKNTSYHNFFMNFANKTKLDIILALKEKPLSVNEISEKINEEQSKVSHNLKALKTCHILDMERKGKKRIYSLNKETALAILNIVEKHVKKNCPFRCEKCKKK